MTHPTNEPLSFRDLVDLGARYVWPLIVCWNVFTYTQTIEAKKEIFNTQLKMSQLELKIAREYTSKADIEKMFADFSARFSDFETRFDKRLDERFSMFEQIIKK
ncbi:hypothetical protein [Desulfoluna spongiiphila]|uniref:hypothetical protein n=1 Tax=Desulfoluna spongiiphila TaxID=419481 RepID=UPI001250FFE3|nr:hypothetical protein [Desulfoluna spongiiphila]VVS91069.1 hypothetical protein DBB_6370 [Desulfoluna spongiiphila]